MLLHLVADYGKDDLAFAEVSQALLSLLPDLQIIATPVPAFDTLSTGFVVGQLSRQDDPARIIYHNTAPRKDDTKKRQDNEGEPLAAVRLGKTLIVGVNAGYAFSFLSEKPCLLKVSNKGSQFRSRDIFPKALARLVTEDKGWNKRHLSPPPIPKDSILYTDGYGNIKTSLSKNLLANKNLYLTINGKREKVHCKKGAFEAPEGTLVLTEGSSGGYLEIFLRGGSASDLFQNPQSATRIRVEK